MTTSSADNANLRPQGRAEQIAACLAALDPGTAAPDLLSVDPVIASLVVPHRRRLRERAGPLRRRPAPAEPADILRPAPAGAVVTTPEHRLDVSRPQAARRCDVLLGGKDNFHADRLSARRIRQELSSTGNPT
jgi:hypothetical protein